jgi:hypothetical protein
MPSRPSLTVRFLLFLANNFQPRALTWLLICAAECNDPDFDCGFDAQQDSLENDHITFRFR